MHQELKIIDKFEGENEIYSNFYPVIVYFEGRNYPSVEHAYVAAKTKDEIFRKMISEIPAEKAWLARRYGRNKKKCKLRKDWDIIKIRIMKNLLMQKFSFERFKTSLLSTGYAILIEGNYWHDNYWGNCYCKKCKDIPGKNNLGNLLMKVRKILGGQ